LIASLDAHAAPHDIVARPKLTGGWEANTMAKAQAVLEAMDRHPDKVISSSTSIAKCVAIYPRSPNSRAM
jgi:hypothetical protein